MSFLERQFPTNISQGSRGGPRWRTVVTQSISGREVRLQKWSNIKSEYDVSYGIKTLADLQAVVDFFNEMRGQAYGFRYKDWLDYSVTDEALTLDGTATTQLIKTYGTGLNNYVRNITKPVSGVTMKRNGSSFTDFTLDTTTGIITFTATIATLTITNISQATEARVTATSHGRSVGDKVLFSGVNGMTQINGQVGTVTATPTANTFDVDINSSAYTAYTSGGTGSVYYENGDAFTWTGEFDVPVRFGQDFLDVSLERPEFGGTSIMLEEVRL